jgi:eukaryotic-like serine/threonine-protein kinase
MDSVTRKIWPADDGESLDSLAARRDLANNLEALAAGDPRPHSVNLNKLPSQQSIDRFGTSDLDDETRILLRTRLRAAAGVLALCFGLYLIRAPFVPSIGSRPVLVAVLSVTGGLYALLSSRRPLGRRGLRAAEVAMFASAALAVAARQHLFALSGAEPWAVTADFQACALYWYSLIVVYATFIPNDYRRAATVIVPLALAPFGVLAIQKLAGVPSVAGIGFEIASDVTLMMIVATATGIFGVHLIHRLRAEAFAARQLGRYKLKRLIGSGGMGEVYLAEHRLLKRPCAIKLIRTGRHSDPRILARFEREVQATAQLTHRNIVNVFDYGRTNDGAFYYVMEFLPGLSLADLVKRHGPLAPARVVHLLRQTCDALREAHACGLLHRDIKPGNIFASQRGGVHDVVKLLDFGLVKPLVESDARRLTIEGTIAGTPLYMAPEQGMQSGEPDVRSDIYALGGVGYFLACGRPPFEAETPMKVLAAHIRDPLVPPSVVRPGIPADLERVLVRCLSKRPEDRFANVEELEEALGRCQAAGQWTPALAADWWRAFAADHLSKPEDQVRL